MIIYDHGELKYIFSVLNPHYHEGKLQKFNINIENDRDFFFSLSKRLVGLVFFQFFSGVFHSTVLKYYNYY